MILWPGNCIKVGVLQRGKKGKYSANMFALAVGPHCGHSVAPISAYPRIVPPKGSGDNRNSDRGDDSGYCGPGYPANGERTVFILTGVSPKWLYQVAAKCPFRKCGEAAGGAPVMSTP